MPETAVTEFALCIHAECDNILASRGRRNSRAETGEKKASLLIETKIYVGLNDSETMKQEHDTLTYVNVLKYVCCSYHVPFSVSLSQGGYMHENGEYTEELTLVISLIDVDKKIIDEIARDLCAFFHQESVMITEDRVRAYFISQDI